MLLLSWSFLQAWVFIEISKIVPCAIPKRFNAAGLRNDEIWFKNRKLASVHLRKTRILVLWNTLEFFIVSGHFPSSTWPRRMFRGQSGCNHRVSNWHFLCKNMGFVWLPERSLLTTGQCYFLRQILSPALKVLRRFPLLGAFLHVEIALKVTEFVVNCVTSCHSQSKLPGACH